MSEPLYRRLSADEFVKYDPADGSYTVVPAEHAPHLVPASPERIWMSLPSLDDHEPDDFDDDLDDEDISYNPETGRITL